MTDIMTEPQAASTTSLLHALADWLDQHPTIDAYDVNLAGLGLTVHVYSINTADDLAEAARTIGGRWNKNAAGDLFKLTREVVPGITVELVAWRKQVCRPVVAATEDVEITEPDPALVAELPTITRIEKREIVEWHCGPLLDDAARVAA